MADLPDDANEFGTDPLALHCIRAVLVFVENTLEGLGVARFVCAVGLGNEPSSARQIAGIPAKVWMNALGDLAEQAPEFGRWGEVASFRCLAVGVLVSLARLFAGLTCPRTRGARRIKAGAQLRDSCFPFVQFRVEGAHLP